MENGDQADQVSHLGFRFRPTKKKMEPICIGMKFVLLIDIHFFLFSFQPFWRPLLAKQ